MAEAFVYGPDGKLVEKRGNGATFDQPIVRRDAQRAFLSARDLFDWIEFRNGHSVHRHECAKGTRIVVDDGALVREWDGKDWVEPVPEPPSKKKPAEVPGG